MLVLVSRVGCGLCSAAEKTLKTKAIPYIKIDYDTNEKELSQVGARSLPMFFAEAISAETYLGGFSNLNKVIERYDL